MPNKHDPYEKLILDRLAQGVLKSQIARELVALGVTSTRDQLSKWIKNRSSRIRKNALLLSPPASVPVQTPKPVQPLSTQPATARPQSKPQPQVDLSDPLAFMRKKKVDFEVPTQEEIQAQKEDDSRIKISKK